MVIKSILCMTFRKCLVSAALCSAASWSQTKPVPDPEPAPPAIEAALRGRVDRFYQAHVQGHFKDAYMMVADDSQDFFLQGGSNKYDACETIKVTFTDHYSKADVIEKCKSDFRWHGETWPTSYPVNSTWKLVNGEWVWYYVPPTEIMTPWGIARMRPEDRLAPGQKPDPLPAKPEVLAANIMNQVGVDKTVVHLQSGKPSEDDVIVTNRMPGQVELQIQFVKQAGFSVRADKTVLPANGSAHVTFRYDPNDPSLACADCAKHTAGTLTANLVVQPVGRVFPISIEITRESYSQPLPQARPAATK